MSRQNPNGEEQPINISAVLFFLLSATLLLTVIFNAPFFKYKQIHLSDQSVLQSFKGVADDIYFSGLNNRYKFAAIGGGGDSTVHDVHVSLSKYDFKYTPRFKGYIKCRVHCELYITKRPKYLVEESVMNKIMADVYRKTIKLRSDKN